MIVSGKTLKGVLGNKWSCNFDPNDPKVKYGPNSIDVTLSNTFLVPVKDFHEKSWNSHIDLTQDFITNKLGEEIPLGDALFDKVESDEYILKPGEFILSSVNETFNCDHPIYVNKVLRYFAPMYEGRSTVARVGIQSHISAAFGDYGFKGSFTLEIVNNSPWSIKIFKGMRIGQVYFVEVDPSVIHHPYQGYDQTDALPQAPRLGSNRF